MKRTYATIWLIALFALACAFASLPGCALFQSAQTTPAIFDSSKPVSDRIASGQAIADGMLKELNALRKAGAVTDDDQRSIAKLRDSADETFRIAWTFANAHDDQNAGAQLTEIQNVLNQLAALYAKSKGAH